MRFLALTALCLMTACGGGGVSLETRPVSPDEFMVTTQAPLAAPKGGAELPAPDLGGPNLADLRPDAQFIAALGGRGTCAIFARCGFSGQSKLAEY